MPHAQRDQREPGGHQVLWLDLPAQSRSDQHQQQRRESAGHESQPRPGRGVGEGGLHQLREQLGRADQDAPDRHHRDEGQAELAVREQADIDNRLLPRQLPGNETGEGGSGDDGKGDDKA